MLLAALLFLLIMLPIRIAGYNPLHCCNLDRWHDICTETANFDFLMLAGTCMRAGDQVSSFHVGSSLVVSAGFKNTTLSNKSCGTALVIGKRFAKARMYPPVLASGKIEGRGMGMRVISSIGDFFLCRHISHLDPGRRLTLASTGKHAG